MGVDFTTWLLGQVDRDDSIGDFATDVASDATWPRPRSAYQARRHLTMNNASDGAFQELEEAWREYKHRGP